MFLYVLLGVSSVALTLFATRRKFYPRPYPGIPFNKEAASRITGDVPDLVPLITASDEFSSSIFSMTTQRLGTPIAQLLLPAIRDPLIILDDPREIEDLLHRRNREFDKAPMSLDLFSPMFPHATISQFTTPKLKAQKRSWADAMSSEFLHRAAAPNIHRATLQLLQLWRLKASTGKPFGVVDDFQNAALDAIWVAVVGEEPGVTSYEIKKTQSQLAGNSNDFNEPLPRGTFVKQEAVYIGQTIARNSNSPVPKWAQKLETYTPRYRRHRRTVTSEIGCAMQKAVDRFQRLDTNKLEADEHDTCMMDLVLRRQVLQAKQAGQALTDPTKDQSMLDEMFTMLVAGFESTGSVLAWFVRFMEAYPNVQADLRAALQSAFPSRKPPPIEDILATSIPYLDAVGEEAFRLAGAAKGNLRQAIVDTEILGCKVPKGAQIFMNYHLNHAPAPVDESKRTAGSRAAATKLGDGLQGDAGRDLGTFEPRRWLVKDENTGQERFNAYAIPSLAFGGGYRGCFGRKLACMEFRIVITLLVLNFEFVELPEDFKSWKATEKIFRYPDMPYAKLREL